MAAPSKLAIATKSLQRLQKELEFYQAELEKQTAAVERGKRELDAKTEKDETGNDEFLLKQLITAIDETKKTIPDVTKKRDEYIQNLREELDRARTSGSGTSAEDMENAQRLLGQIDAQ